MYSYSHSPSSNSPWTDNHYHHPAHTSTQYEESPVSSPQNTQPRPPVSFPQPLSAPHNQPTFPHQYSSRYSSDRMQYLEAPSLDRRMSEPALLSGNHPAAYRVSPSSEQSGRYSNPYATSTYSPPDVHYQAVSRPSYAEHSRNDSAGSSVGNTYANESRSHWTGNIKQEDAYTDINAINPLSYSPRPSTGSGSTGADATSPLPTYSLSAASPTSAVSISPDLPSASTQQFTELSARNDYHQPSSPSSSNKTYAFVSLPGTTIRKRPRRRYDEIERLYHCSWPDCTKAYGTLNHLNAHVVMQKHGPRRLPAGNLLGLSCVYVIGFAKSIISQNSKSYENSGERRRKRAHLRPPPQIRRILVPLPLPLLTASTPHKIRTTLLQVHLPRVNGGGV
jgi:transcription factor CON7